MSHFEYWIDPETKSRIFHLVILDNDMQEAGPLDEFDTKLIDEFGNSSLVSDKLLALSALVRHIEKAGEVVTNGS